MDGDRISKPNLSPISPDSASCDGGTNEPAQEVKKVKLDISLDVEMPSTPWYATVLVLLILSVAVGVLAWLGVGHEWLDWLKACGV